MQNNQTTEPKPVEVRADGKGLYILDGYRIWAKTYQDALENLKMIQRF